VSQKLGEPEPKTWRRRSCAWFRFQTWGIKATGYVNGTLRSWFTLRVESLPTGFYFYYSAFHHSDVDIEYRPAWLHWVKEGTFFCVGW